MKRKDDIIWADYTKMKGIDSFCPKKFSSSFNTLNFRKLTVNSIYFH